MRPAIEQQSNKGTKRETRISRIVTIFANSGGIETNGGSGLRSRLSVTDPDLNESGRGQPHSTTCRRRGRLTKRAKRRGVRLPSVAFVIASAAGAFSHLTDRSCLWRILLAILCGWFLTGQASAAPKKPKPAKIKISGYGLVGDYEL